LAYGPTFESAMAGLFGGAASSAISGPATAETGPQGTLGGATSQPGTQRDALITQAARDLSDYQRLTAEGKLGEAGQKLEHLKRTLDQLNTRTK